MVRIKTLPPKAPPGRALQDLATAPGGVEVTLPQVKPRFLNWRQAHELYLALQLALTKAVRP